MHAQVVDDTEVARHRRQRQPHQRVVDPRHFDGLYRPRDQAAAPRLRTWPSARRVTRFLLAKLQPPPSGKGKKPTRKRRTSHLRSRP